MKNSKKILLTAMTLLASVGSFAAEMAVGAADTKYAVTLADDGDAHGTVLFTVGGEVVTQALADEVVTVGVTPDEGYAPKDVTVRPYTSFENSGRYAPRMLNITAEKQQDGTWTFTMPKTDVEIGVTYVKTLQDSWIQAIADQTYTGEAVEPTVTVKDGSSVLTPGTDYTVTYTENVEAGTATVTVKATGSEYEGEVTATFTIQKADITMTKVPEAVGDLVYSGEPQTLITAGEASFGTVLYSIDGENYTETLPQATDAGTYTVYYKVEGDENHNGFGPETLDVTIATDKTALNDIINEAEEYYEDIKDSKPDAADELKDAIDDAKTVRDDDDATQPEIDDAVKALEDALEKAKKEADDDDSQSGDDDDDSQNGDGDDDSQNGDDEEENTSTGIGSAKAAAEKDGNWYDLQGRRVTQSAKGLHIKDGKKILVK